MFIVSYQLCVNIQFPQEVGGVGGKALYLDTNQNFNPHRFKGKVQEYPYNLEKSNILHIY